MLDAYVQFFLLAVDKHKELYFVQPEKTPWQCSRCHTLNNRRVLS